jgi:hypothetical protein
LWREWDTGKDQVLFVGLNPSTADHRLDDPTIRRCVAFAKRWGFGRLAVANLFAFRTPKPSVLRKSSAPVGPANDCWLARLVTESALVVAAWGAGGRYLHRSDEVLSMLETVLCLGVTAHGEPRHPLYIRADTPPMSFRR